MSVLKLNSEPVRKEWLDAYSHLNEAYYQAERLGVRGACIFAQPEFTRREDCGYNFALADK